MPARYSPARLALGTRTHHRRRHRAPDAPHLPPHRTRPPLRRRTFTAVSAVCVTGLTTVDTATRRPFGQAVIAAGIVVGGLGVLTSHRSFLDLRCHATSGLTQRMLATQEAGTGAMGQISTLLSRVIATSLSMQAFSSSHVPRFLGFDPCALSGMPSSWRLPCSTTRLRHLLPGGPAPHVTDWWMLIPHQLWHNRGRHRLRHHGRVAKNLRTQCRWRLQYC